VERKVEPPVDYGDAADGRDESVRTAYVPPRIVTYTSEELLEQVGPALTCSPSPGL